MNNKFTDGILLEYKNGIYTLMRDLRAYYLKDDNKIYVTVPKGFKTDIASTPRFLYPILPPTGEHNGASIVHDYVYSVGRLNRKDCDIFFLQLLGASKINKVIRSLAYCGVRIGGRSHYLKNI